MAGLIGALRVSLSADTAAFSAGMTRAQRQAQSSSSVIQKALGGIKAGLTGLAAGITVGAVVALAQRSLEYASSLGEVAQQLGVTATALQEFRYMATQTGVDQETMDKSLAKLTQTMGKAAAGAEAPQKAFAAIGISLDDLRGKTATDVLSMMADGLAKIESPAQRAAIEVAILGRAGQQLDTMLSGGSGAINELRDAAQRLGVVLSDEQIRSADETADKLAALKMVLEARIAGVVADNADSILTLANSLATLVNGIGNAISAWKNFKSAMGQMRNASEGWTFGMPNRGDGAQAARGRYLRESLAQDFPNPGKPNPKPKPPVIGGGDGAQFLAGGGGGSKGPKGKSADQLAADAKRLREEAIRDAYRAAEDERRGRMAVLRAQQDLLFDAKDRGVISEQLLALEREGEQAQIANNLAMGDITAAQAQKLQGLVATEFGYREEKQKQDEAYQIQQDMIERHRAIETSALEIQEMEASLADTAAERRAIELKIVKARFEQLRQIQQDIIDDPRASQEQRDAAGRRQIHLGKLEGGATTQVLKGTMGPMEQFLASIPTSAAKANEAFEAVAANGLESLTDGITDAITGARSLGDVFKNVANSIIADLVRIGVQRMIIEPLANKLFGAGGGEQTAGKFESILSGIQTGLTLAKPAGGRALGGPVLPGRTYRVGERGPEFLTMGAKGVITPDNDNGGRTTVTVIPSPLFDVRVGGIADGRVATAAPSLARLGSFTAQAELERKRGRALA